MSRAGTVRRRDVNVRLVARALAPLGADQNGILLASSIDPECIVVVRPELAEVLANCTLIVAVALARKRCRRNTGTVLLSQFKTVVPLVTASVVLAKAVADVCVRVPTVV